MALRLSEGLGIDARRWCATCFARCIEQKQRPFFAACVVATSNRLFSFRALPRLSSHWASILWIRIDFRNNRFSWMRPTDECSVFLWGFSSTGSPSADSIPRFTSVELVTQVLQGRGWGRLRGSAASRLFNLRRKALTLLARRGLSVRCLTFELSGRRRQDARPGPVKMYRVPPARAWWPAVGAPLEREVRPHLQACAECRCPW